MKKDKYIQEFKKLNPGATTEQAEKTRKRKKDFDEEPQYSVVKVPATYKPLPPPKELPQEALPPEPMVNEEMMLPPEPQIDPEIERNKILEKILDSWSIGLHRINLNSLPKPQFPQHPVTHNDATITDILYIVRKLYKSDTFKIPALLVFLTSNPKVILEWSKTGNSNGVVSMWKQNGLVFDATTGWSSMILPPLRIEFLEENINEYKHSHPKTIDLDEIELDEIGENPLNGVKTVEQLFALLGKHPELLETITDTSLEFYELTPTKIREIRSIYAIEDKNERGKRLREFKSGVSTIVVGPPQQQGGTNVSNDVVDVSLMAIVI